MLPQLLSCAYSYKYLEVLWLLKRTKLWACFNTEPNRLYRRLRLFPSKLQEYTPPPFSRLSTQYHIDPLLTCFLSLDTSQTSLRLQQSTKFGNRHTAHGRYEYSYNLANSRENWAQKKKIASGMHFVHNTSSTEVIMVMCFLCHAHWLASCAFSVSRPLIRMRDTVLQSKRANF